MNEDNTKDSNIKNMNEWEIKLWWKWMCPIKLQQMKTLTECREKLREHMLG